MEHEQLEVPTSGTPSVVIRVTHIRDGQVLGVTETPADEFQFHMKEGSNGSHE